MSYLMRVNTTEKFKIDLIAWLIKCWDNGYGKKFERLSPSEREDLIEDFKLGAITSINDSVHLPDYTPKLSIRDKYRTSLYHDLELVPEHFEIELCSEFIKSVIIRSIPNPTT